MSALALPDLLRRRFDMVAQLCEATARLQKCQQARMSVDMDVQRCEMASGSATPGVQQELVEAFLRAEAADEAIARCESQIAEIEAALDETDREIATASRRRATS